MSSDCETLFHKVFGIQDHTEGAYKIVHDADGNVSNEQGGFEQIKFIFDAFDAFQGKFEEEDYRVAHNWEHLDLDARIVLRNDHDEDIPMLAPKMVGLVTLFRYIVFHPKRSAQENFDLSKAYTVDFVTKIRTQVDGFREANAELIAKFPELGFDWLNDDFVAKIPVFFDILSAGKIPTTMGNYDEHFYENVDFNTAVWVLDIHMSINGQDSSTHSGWEVGLRSEHPWMGLDEYKAKRQAEWDAMVKPYVFNVSTMKKDFGKYVKDNIADFDFDMNEPYEEDLEELAGKIPAL